MSTIFSHMKSAVVEKDVENVWRTAILDERPSASVSSPFGCDGLFEWEGMRMLVEFKFDVDMKSRTELAKLLAQVVRYMKKLDQSGRSVDVILLADRNECLVYPAASLSGFLSGDFDWTIAPSASHPVLESAIVSGLNFVPHVFDVGPKFKLGPVLEKAEGLARDGKHVTKATPANIGEIFRHWREHVFTGKLKPVDQVDVFLRCLFDPVEVYLHPNKKNSLVVPGYADGVQVHSDRYRAFFDSFSQGYKPSEVESFYASKDRLIDDDARRRQGAFFTPRIWVDEAHRTIESVLGPTWRDDCIVWDPAAGTGNLTRDYTFADLIISTAERSDVETIKTQGYNPGASIFQYDFLNPDAPSPFFGGELSKLPASVDAQLRAAAKAGKRLVFFMNPPYGTAGVAGATGESRAGIATTEVNTRMKQAKIGKPAQQLYAQFMWQAMKVAAEFGFNQRTVAVFCKPTFMTSESYRTFRSTWYSEHTYQAGFMLQASHFADVSGAWGISFTLWSEGQTTRDKHVPIRLIEHADFGLLVTGHKAIYSSDGRSAMTWWKACVRSTALACVAPQLTSGLKAGGKNDILFEQGAVLDATNHGNSLQNSQDGAFLTSSCNSKNRGANVPTYGVRATLALFAARKLVLGTWINDKDEYLAPDESREGYLQWVDDAHVFALLHPSNNCTAMRDVDYASRKWTISNHLFWRSRATCLADLDTSHTFALYRDCKARPAGYVVPPPAGTPREQWEVDGDPYLAHVLPGLDLSPEARDVLARLDALWLTSLPQREAYAAEHPELHLLAWDAGVYQLKHLWRDHYPEEWKGLQEIYKRLADKLRPGVYDYGFLL